MHLHTELVGCFVAGRVLQVAMHAGVSSTGTARCVSCFGIHIRLRHPIPGMPFRVLRAAICRTPGQGLQYQCQRSTALHDAA